MPGNPHIPSDNATIACALNELGLRKVPDVIVRTVAFDGLLIDNMKSQKLCPR